MDICVVIVTYNRLAKLKQAIAAQQQPHVTSIVVVNNASTDTTAEYLGSLTLQPPITLKVISLEDNIGGAGGFAAGLAYARDNISSCWVVLADDDAYPEPDAYQQFALMNVAGEPKAQLVAAAVYYPNGDICPMNTPMALPRFSTLLGNLFRRQSPSAMPKRFYSAQSITPVMAASFVGLFIPTKALRDSQILPNKRFFLYWDDISYCIDMTNAGYSIQFNPLIKFTHDCHRTDRPHEDHRFYYLVRNGIWTFAKFSGPVRWFYLPLKKISWLLYALKTGSLSTYTKALRDSKQPS